MRGHVTTPAARTNERPAPQQKRIKLNQHYERPQGGQHHYRQAPPPPPPHYTPPPTAYGPPPEPPKKKRTGLKVFGGIVGGLIVLGAIGNATNGSAPQPATTASLPSSPSAPAAQSQQQAPAVVEAQGPDFSQGIPDGQYIVGDEVAPGRYKSAGAQAGIFELCSISTKRADGGVIDWKTGNKGDQVLITVTKEADTIEIHGCEPLQKVG
jgi:hypothetical protein